MSNTNSVRVFEDKPAVRERIPCVIGIIGPSRSGKTFSAMRLATGMQSVTGGDIGVIDTEAKRALHYCEHFKFRHLPFGAPFGSLDYLAAVKHFVGKGVRTIVVDSMSHEHDGPGGLLEKHEEETKRLAKAWNTTEAKAQISAWITLKADRRRMINEILQMDINAIFCFRAKDKLKVVKGKDPVAIGYQPIGGEEFPYELLVNFLLLPGSHGIPNWKPDHDVPGVEIPEQFKGLLGPKVQLSEDIGRSLAEWSQGTKAGDATPAPKSPRELMVGAWGKLGVTEQQLVARLGHSLDAVTPDERKALADLGKAIKGGTATWETVIPIDAIEEDEFSREQAAAEAALGAA